MMGNPLWCSSRWRRPVNLPNITYRNKAPIDIFGWTDNTSVLRPHSDQRPDPSQGPSRNMDSVLHPMGTLMANTLWEWGAKLINYLLSAAIQPSDGAGGKFPDVSNFHEWHYRDLMHFPEAAQKKWKTTCYEELESLNKCDVFELTDLPNGHKTIGYRWVFNVKSDGHKEARLVSQSFSQVESVDYNKLFSPVVWFESMHLMLALAALHNWYMMGVDVHTAYLYRKLDKEIYMSQSEGFIARGQESKVIHLKRALYSLKQAGLAWWKELSNFHERSRFYMLMRRQPPYLENHFYFIFTVKLHYRMSTTRHQYTMAQLWHTVACYEAQLWSKLSLLLY